MKTHACPLVLAAAALTLFQGCIAYNEQCQGLVEDPEEVVGYLAEKVYLDKPNARHDNNAIGQMEADAFADAFSDLPRPAAFGVVNGGGIRAEGLCVTRNVLKPGKLTKGVIHEILLFENLVKAVDLTEPEIQQMMEHSVERLFPAAGDGGVAAPIISPAGQFLQVSSAVKMDVDCSKPPGGRVDSITIGGVKLTGNPEKKYRVALTAYLLGGDGYDMLVAPAADPNRDPVQAQRNGGTDNNITADYMKRTYNKDQASGLRKDPSRINLKNCAVPPAPAG